MSPQMKRMLVCVGIVFGIIFVIYALKKAAFGYLMSHYEPPPVTISAATATEKTWQSYMSSVGTLTAVQGTDVSAEVSGMVTEIRFNSGQFVHQGDVLVLLDTSVEEAQLKNDKAKLALAQINFDRNNTLLKKNVLSKAEYDITASQLDEAKADLEGTAARIKQKTITAPFSGKIGIRQINVGQFVSAGTSMVTLQALDPLYVQFNLPEQYLLNLYPNQPVDITVNRNGTKNATFKGVITAINSKIDQATRNILVQATLPNTNLQLFPGMFAQVKVWETAQQHVITLPQTAISYSLHGDSVFLITSKDKNLYVSRQYVKVGERRDGEIAILQGIKANDQVVTSGQLKLQNDTHVVIDNSVEL